MMLLARKKTSTEAGWIVFAVIFSTFSSALIIFLCWRNTRGSSKKSSSAQQQSGNSESRTISRRSVRYWYYYPEYFSGYNGSSESSEYHYANTGREYHLEQTPNYYIYPPTYPPCPDPPPPPPRPPRTPPHIAVYRTRPVNVMSFLDRTQMRRKPPPVTEVTSPERTSTPSHESGSSSSSDSGPDEPLPDGDGPPPSGPSGSPSDGPHPDGPAPGSTTPAANPMGVRSPKEDGSVISKQDVSEAQANFSKLMSEAELRSQHPHSSSEAESQRDNSARRISGVRYVKAPTNASSKERRRSMAVSPHGRSPASSNSNSPTAALRDTTPKPSSHASHSSSKPSIRSHTSRRLDLNPLSPGSRAPSHHSLRYAASRHSSPPQSPTRSHHSQIPSSPNRHSRSYSRSHSNPTSRHSSPPQSPTPPHQSPIPHFSGRQSYGRPTSRHSPRSRSIAGSGVSSMPPSPTVTDFAPISAISHPLRSPAPPGFSRSSLSPAYRSGGFKAALSPQPDEQDERKGSRQSSSRYSRHSGEKSPSVVSVSVVELLSLEKEQDGDVGMGEPMSLLDHEEYEESEKCGERQGSEDVMLDENEVQRRGRRSVSANSQQQRGMDLAEHEEESVEMGHDHDSHGDQDPESEPEPEQAPEDYYTSYSPVAPASITNPIPSSPNLSGHSSNLSPKSPYHPRKYIPIQVPKENRPHQASVCSVSDSTDSGIGGIGEAKKG
ncbi:hypothetical protein GE21DRAFT_6047 [Neurospora crassa]|uniref:Uncharacterized protein n=1 Tax=Neurospora crassa (strain ATCC 24698 / 74-OR23-1A / CBS 708.71 / DSM 1257 / FGSC 987) TaxID=367110 RepID=Q7RYE3_NEUCR|nr:hypothetical protein NCU04464 [Neurospora crassa OR74A]EAA27797.1 hypothetical protein NCU04464 [Neurospora crassa OR74A]KHE88618.1 hypothetical protein GE21DRAFT_6047 [Neurospora crassa]|eukprot:XP_957033.1 hypothetical protein NCU04464 [Neurospora crassa OR74A]